jgi:hypothetical protein
MISTELPYLCKELECYVLSGNALDRVGMLSAGLECFLQLWNAFDSVGKHLYRVGMLRT